MSNCISFHENQKRVLMTGFAPFGGMDRNSSWEGVKDINKEEVKWKLNIHLFREEILVRYYYVDMFIPKLWDQLEPDLAIDVGMSEIAECFVLETQACKFDYHLPDDGGCCPGNSQNQSSGPEMLATHLDVEVICKEFNQLSTDGLQADMSNDAGRYVCEYIYYTSLSRSASRTLFIHVPDTNVYSVEQIGRGLERILEICLRQLNGNQQFGCYL